MIYINVRKRLHGSDGDMLLEAELELKKGDIIKLNRPADDTVVVKVDGREKFIADFGVQRYRRAIRIKEILKRNFMTQPKN